jgi:hypothetical protein
LAAVKQLGLEGEWHNVLARLSAYSAPSLRLPPRRNGFSETFEIPANRWLYRRHVLPQRARGLVAAWLPAICGGIHASTDPQRSRVRFPRTAETGPSPRSLRRKNTASLTCRTDRHLLSSSMVMPIKATRAIAASFEREPDLQRDLIPVHLSTVYVAPNLPHLEPAKVPQRA